MERPSVALIGNPNSGKTSVFNYLTGLRQKVGNFPGVTVEKKSGLCKLNDHLTVNLIDLPGTYSLYPTAKDEQIVASILTNPADQHYPQAILYVADLTNLDRHLLLLTQIRDLGLPVVLALNMKDLAEQEGVQYQVDRLEQLLRVPCIDISSRTGENVDILREKLANVLNDSASVKPSKQFYDFSIEEQNVAVRIAKDFGIEHPYHALLLAHHADWLEHLAEADRKSIQKIRADAGFDPLRMQVRETMQRYDRFLSILKKGISVNRPEATSLTDKIDRVVTHSVFGPIIFVAIMLFVFQAIYSWSSIPMDLIEGTFSGLAQLTREMLPAAWYTDLIADGILAGLGGILIFIPQIAILFLLIGILEEIGYMSRAVFMFDSVMQRFGLNGRSIVALISGGACAIPAIMSTRTISNPKERLITIMVTPFISCSARIPVYTVLIGFVVPAYFYGPFNLQGLAFMGLYFLGILAALITALVFKWALKSEQSSYLMIELPAYRLPVARNLVYEVYEKVKAFVVEAGKIIFFISIILWFAASYGPGDKMELAETAATEQAAQLGLDEMATDNLIASRKIEASYAGHLGKAIEPAIRPLGYDWKIGIALITSFAAREVFIGTMATIYSIGSEEDELRIKERMAKERNPITGAPVYTVASALSLLLFYVFAMQCMSTLAVVKRETNSWFYPALQFIMMTAVAYLAALVSYQLLS